jgi:hypothetical protein
MWPHVEGVQPSRAIASGLIVSLGVAVACGTCANRRTSGPPAWAATPQAQVPGPGRSAPPPPVTPELDPENTEQRFGFNEARARRDYARQNGQKPPGAAAQAVVPLPQGAPTPAASPPAAQPTPDAGARDGAPPRSR